MSILATIRWTPLLIGLSVPFGLIVLAIRPWTPDGWFALKFWGAVFGISATLAVCFILVGVGLFGP